jgi:hypothetical protein
MVSNMVSSSNKSLTLPMSRMIVELHPPMRGPDGVYAVYIYGELHNFLCVGHLLIQVDSRHAYFDAESHSRGVYLSTYLNIFTSP